MTAPSLNDIDQTMPVCSRTTTTEISARVHRSWTTLEPEFPAWEALLDDALYASIYATHEFCRLGWEAFHQHESALFVVTLYHDEQLIAVFPMRLEDTRVAGIRHTVLMPVHLREADKPYPLIAKAFVEQAWAEFMRVAMAHRQEWDILNWPELPDELPGVDCLRESLRAYGSLRLETQPDASGPLVDLAQDQDTFTGRHRRFRRALRRLHKQTEGEVTLKLYSEAADMEDALKHYTDVERRSWKAGRIGVSRNARALQFHQTLCPALAKRGRIVIAILFDGETPISAEIAYICRERVFFSHGAFDSGYADLSPGKISTGLFIGSFLQGQYRWGDFLAGFADYLEPWSDTTMTSREVFVYQPRPAALVLWAWRKLGLRKKLSLLRQSVRERLTRQKALAK